MDDLYIYQFTAYYGGEGRHPTDINVLCNQCSTAWAAAVEKATRIGPLALYSIRYDDKTLVEGNVTASFLKSYDL